jgi:hypothetical protein
MLPCVLEPTRQVIECMTSSRTRDNVHNEQQRHDVLLCDVVDEQGASCATIIRTRDRTETFLTGLVQWTTRGRRRRNGDEHVQRTVSQICSLICLPSMVIIRAPNSTPKMRRENARQRTVRVERALPMVRSWTG